jgi:hypothetical protein
MKTYAMKPNVDGIVSLIVESRNDIFLVVDGEVYQEYLWCCGYFDGGNFEGF